MKSEIDAPLLDNSALLAFAEQVEANRGELISRFQQALRKNLFTNRSQFHPRSLAAIASYEADALIKFLRTRDSSDQEHGAYLCSQGLSSKSVFSLGQVYFEFFYSILGSNQLFQELSANYLNAMLEGFFEARDKLILDEQESFRMAFQMALDYSNSQMQAARQTAQDAVEASYRSEILAQEAERRRISRELHDEASQALIALHMTLENLLNDEQPDHVSKREFLEKAVAMTDDVLRNIRRLAYNLRPPVLDLLGINLTLKQFCREFGDQARISVNYAGVELPLLADEYSITLYRVTQEAFNNIFKHANAKHVWVKLCRSNDKVELMIKDDGKGFEPDTAKKGLGILGMQERLRLLRGDIKIESSLGKFTRIDVVLPIVLKVGEHEPTE